MFYLKRYSSCLRNKTNAQYAICMHDRYLFNIERVSSQKSKLGCQGQPSKQIKTNEWHSQANEAETNEKNFVKIDLSDTRMAQVVSSIFQGQV